MNIGVESSANVFMIADPSNTLDADEVHVSFSRPFKDSQGFDQYLLHGVDVLVARLPAQLPSDIQRVRTVFRPELEQLRDVVVFSSRGRTSLASKLSGGDYDGDKAWICWDQNLVAPFENANVPDQRPPEFFGISKDESKVSDFVQSGDYITKFLVHAFEFNLQRSLLGKCTLHHEALCYARGDINSPEAIQLAQLAGHLVDGPKNGLKFNDSAWTALMKRMNLPQRLGAPAYKDRRRSKPTNNLIDDLVFNVAIKKREDVLRNFDRNFKDAFTWDDDLVKLYKQETEVAKTDPSIGGVISRIKSAVNEIVDYWRLKCPHVDDDGDSFWKQEKRGENPAHVSLTWWKSVGNDSSPSHLVQMKLRSL